MGLTAADVMTPDVRTVTPGTTLTELNRILMWERLSGAVVVDGDKLVGVVSLSDVVRVLFDEQVRSRDGSAFYANPFWFPFGAWQQMLGGARAGRLSTLRVADVMTREPQSVRTDEPIEEVASLLWNNGFHRVPVVDAGRLVGVVTALDIVRVVADKGAGSPLRGVGPQPDAPAET